VRHITIRLRPDGRNGPFDDAADSLEHGITACPYVNFRMNSGRTPRFEAPGGGIRPPKEMQ